MSERGHLANPTFTWRGEGGTLNVNWALGRSRVLGEGRVVSVKAAMWQGWDSPKTTWGKWGVRDCGGAE